MQSQGKLEVGQLLTIHRGHSEVVDWDRHREGGMWRLSSGSAGLGDLNTKGTRHQYICYSAPAVKMDDELANGRNQS